MPLAVLGPKAAFRNVEEHNSWPKSPEAREARLTGIAKPEIRPSFTIDKEDRIFAMGSCFARNIEVQLLQMGYNVATRDLIFPDHLMQAGDRGVSMLNKFVAHSIENEIRWAVDSSSHFPAGTIWEVRPGKHIDPHLGATIPQDRALVDERRNIINAWMKNVTDCNVIILTLGLVEAWYDTRHATYLNTAPTKTVRQTLGDALELHLLDYNDVLASLERTFALLSTYSKRDFRILISVSPVALGVSFFGSDALTANCYSKSVQRAAVEAFVRNHENVDYFPSYESITLSDRSLAWEDDQAHVSAIAIRSNMLRMVEAYTDNASETSTDGGAFNDKLKSLDVAVQARAAADAGDPATAAELFARAVELSPDDPNILLRAGKFHHQAEQYAVAEDLLVRCRNHGGKMLGVDYLLAQTLFRRGKFDAAQTAVEEALQREPTRPGILNLRNKIEAGLAGQAVA